jgi:hypothetical protein
MTAFRSVSRKCKSHKQSHKLTIVAKAKRHQSACPIILLRFKVRHCVRFCVSRHRILIIKIKQSSRRLDLADTKKKSSVQVWERVRERIPQSTLASNDFTRDWQNFVIGRAGWPEESVALTYGKARQGKARIFARSQRRSSLVSPFSSTISFSGMWWSGEY